MSEPESSPSHHPAPRSHRGFLGSILQYTRGLIFEQHVRRQTMFYTVLAAMLMAFVGDTFFGEWLREKLVRFVVWWLACGWLTVLAALLALYDLLLLRVQHRLARRELRARLLKEVPEED